MTARRFLNGRTVHCALVGAFALLVASLEPAAAQFPPPPGPNEQQMPSSGPFPAPPGVGVPSGGGGFVTEWPPRAGAPAEVQISEAQVSEAQRICLTFPAIRKELEKDRDRIRAAGDRKAARDETCPLFKAFTVKEAEMVRFLETNQQLCGVPVDIVTQVKQNHDKSIQICDNVCGFAVASASSCRTKIRI